MRVKVRQKEYQGEQKKNKEKKYVDEGTIGCDRYLIENEKQYQRVTHSRIQRVHE